MLCTQTPVPTLFIRCSTSSWPVGVSSHAGIGACPTSSPSQVLPAETSFRITHDGASLTESLKIHRFWVVQLMAWALICVRQKNESSGYLRRSRQSQRSQHRNALVYSRRPRQVQFGGDRTENIPAARLRDRLSQHRTTQTKSRTTQSNTAKISTTQRNKQVRGSPPVSMVAYWAVDRQGLQEAATHANSADGIPAFDGAEAVIRAGSASNGNADKGTNGSAGNGTKERGTGVSQQERSFLDIVAR